MCEKWWCVVDFFFPFPSLRFLSHCCSHQLQGKVKAKVKVKDGAAGCRFLGRSRAN